MRRLSWIMLSLVFVFIFSTSSKIFAEENESYYYVLKGGIYSPENDDVKDADEGINLEAAIGTYTSEYFGAEMGFGFFQTKFKEPSNVKITAKFFPITFNLLGNYPVGPVEMYGGGGIGAYISKTEVTENNQSDSEVHTSYGFQALLGGRYNLLNNLFVGMEGKYIWTKTPELTLLDRSIPDIHYDGFIVTVNVGSRF